MSDEQIRPIRLRALDRAAGQRCEAVDQLVTFAEAVAAMRCDVLDRFGLLRLAELQVHSVRRRLVAEARAAGFSWIEIATTLAISEGEARRRYGGGEPG